MICDAEGAMYWRGVRVRTAVYPHPLPVSFWKVLFSGAGIRRSESRLGLKTDASSRFAKGTDPEMTVAAHRKSFVPASTDKQAETRWRPG